MAIRRITTNLDKHCKWVKIGFGWLKLVEY